jgi:hypothetical protein
VFNLISKASTKKYIKAIIHPIAKIKKLSGSDAQHAVFVLHDIRSIQSLPSTKLVCLIEKNNINRKNISHNSFDQDLILNFIVFF